MITESANILSQYIRIESLTGNEKPAGEFFTGICKEMGFHIRIFSDHKNNYNFACSIYPLESKKPNIILHHHIDVVPGNMDGNWKYPPFSGTIAENFVWGRGAIDMKGMAVMQLMAAREYLEISKKRELPFNITLLGVSGEEDISSRGAQYVTENYFEELNPVLVLGEGGAGLNGLLKSRPLHKVFCVSIADKRTLWIRLSLSHPASGHGSVPPPQYANKIKIKALYHMLLQREKLQFTNTTREIFKHLGKLEGGIRGFILKYLPFFKRIIGKILRKQPLVLASLTDTYTITHIGNPEGSFNQIPQKISIQLDCRLLPHTQTKDFIQSVEKNLGLSDLEIEIVQETPNANPSTTGGFFPVLEEAIKEVFPGSSVIPYLFPAHSDNNFFRSKGVPVYGLTPAFFERDMLESIHNENEKISIENIEKGIEVYKCFFGKLTKKNLSDYISVKP
jgi:carboxypeptidase PM20D1